ncbi:cold shock domain-containing protein [Vibrio sp. JPW-9-11-11]|uniref:cold shock domain-containing protein n=1 Tax=Vibrio sp. JPW-9-11-11 TaxID=1416532 RepID=UPI001593D0C8|nr:cold shock domain-containing protein [Vibrio sp. JPW-9-11-11]NVD08969.1 cold shock domain-containing protein [Vibrio sp. JPW-9-11-11]
MAVLGKIVDWDQKHGYGFIEDTAQRQKVFFHIRDMRDSQSEPHINELVQFDVISDQNGCHLALNISSTLMK